MLPTSRPRVGWSSTSSLRSRSNSRATTTFCWLPPDSVPARTSRRRRADVVLARCARSAVVGDRLVVAQDAAREGRPVVVGQDEVVRDREGQDEPEAVAIRRDVRDARLVHLARGPAGHVDARQRRSSRPSRGAARSAPRPARPGRCRRRRRCPGSRRRGPRGRRRATASWPRSSLTGSPSTWSIDVARDATRPGRP